MWGQNGRVFPIRANPNAYERSQRQLSQQLIAALEDASSAEASRNANDLAQRAYDKLQFDFPVSCTVNT